MDERGGREGREGWRRMYAPQFLEEDGDLDPVGGLRGVERDV